jgi:hypothetical protein
LIEGYHLLLDSDPEGKTPLAVSLPPPAEGEPWAIKAQVLWYNRIEAKRRYQFDVGLRFVDFSPSDQKKLRDLLDSLPDKDS